MIECDSSPWWVQVGKSLLQCKQEEQAEMVDLHTLSAKEARAAVLCVLRNIQVFPSSPAYIPARIHVLMNAKYPHISCVPCQTPFL